MAKVELRSRSVSSPIAGDAARLDTAAHSAAAPPATVGTLIAVLGVVYGDIGTSPLYALKASLLHFAADGIDRGEVLGILSMILWSLILVVTVKYVLLILRADNRGEGGIMALTALAQRHLAGPRTRRAAALVGIAGGHRQLGAGLGGWSHGR